MNLSLASRRALVCGSTQGIGRAAAIEIASLGASVTLMARNADQLKAVAAELPHTAGQTHDFLVADFSDPANVAAAIAPAIDPNRPYHILVNNTGGPKGGPIAAAAGDEFAAAFKMHVLSNQALVQALLPGMRSAKYGRIINVISTSVKAPIEGLGVSNTIRAAVANWAKTLATEVGPLGITVNNVLPGFTDTARLDTLFKAKAEKLGKTKDDVLKAAIATIPAGRLGEAAEIAAAVAFLATPAAAYINGINLPVDGGRTPSL
ncbi:MAG: SDR family oxidoreductase [Phycisphaerales bacterium]